jgi:hypothetical protein
MTETGFLVAEIKKCLELRICVYPGFRLTVGRIQAANNCHDDLVDIRSRTGEHNFEQCPASFRGIKMEFACIAGLARR